jgi:hypothetical protein
MDTNTALYAIASWVLHAPPDIPMSGSGKGEGKRALTGRYIPPKKDSEPIKRESPKISPNQLCPCGSLKKFKKCCKKT